MGMRDIILQLYPMTSKLCNCTLRIRLYVFDDDDDHSFQLTFLRRTPMKMKIT